MQRGDVQVFPWIWILIIDSCSKWRLPSSSFTGIHLVIKSESTSTLGKMSNRVVARWPLYESLRHTNMHVRVNSNRLRLFKKKRKPIRDVCLLKAVVTMIDIDVSKFTPISLIQQVLAESQDAILFKLPTSTSGVWKDITYAEFLADIERIAFHFLSRKTWPEESIIGVWTSGMSYADIVHFLAVIRAGCIPYLINTELSKTLDGGISDLLNESNASGLFVDHSLLGNNFSGLKFTQVFVIKDPSEYPDEINRHSLPDLPTVFPSDRLVFILNTSGTSGGRCKIIPYNFRMYTTFTKKRKYVTQVCRRNLDRKSSPHTSARLGSFCHIAQILEFTTIVSFGSSFILVSPNFGSSMLLQMYQECGLTACSQFTMFIQQHLQNSRNDSILLNALKSMNEVGVMGSALPETEISWAVTNKIPLLNGFGSTECGTLLVAWPWTGNPTHFSLLELDDIHHALQSIFETDRDVEITVDINKTQDLKELVILSNSMDCPHPSLRSKVDGHFHTGDIFQEIPGNLYVYRGRMDDFIKMENARICDTMGIENHVRKTCGDIIHACVVFGYSRPSPTLLVEPKIENSDKDQMIAFIDQQLTTYNSHVYQHERVVRDHIIVVSKGSLPRTLKGNIRRKVTEQVFSQQLNELYGPVKTLAIQSVLTATKSRREITSVLEAGCLCPHP